MCLRPSLTWEHLEPGSIPIYSCSPALGTVCQMDTSISQLGSTFGWTTTYFFFWSTLEFVTMSIGIKTFINNNLTKLFYCVCFLACIVLPISLDRKLEWTISMTAPVITPISGEIEASGRFQVYFLIRKSRWLHESHKGNVFTEKSHVITNKERKKICIFKSHILTLCLTMKLHIQEILSLHVA